MILQALSIIDTGFKMWKYTAHLLCDLCLHKAVASPAPWHTMASILHARWHKCDFGGSSRRRESKSRQQEGQLGPSGALSPPSGSQLLPLPHRHPQLNHVPARPTLAVHSTSSSVLVKSSNRHAYPSTIHPYPEILSLLEGGRRELLRLEKKDRRRLELRNIVRPE